MPTFLAIVEFLKEFFKNLPLLNRWFTKTAAEKTQDDKEEEMDENEKFKKTGRPEW